jgi:hypothetical protein
MRGKQFYKSKTILFSLFASFSVLFDYLTGVKASNSINEHFNKIFETGDFNFIAFVSFALLIFARIMSESKIFISKTDVSKYIDEQIKKLDSKIVYLHKDTDTPLIEAIQQKLREELERLETIKKDKNARK